MLGALDGTTATALSPVRPRFGTFIHLTSPAARLRVGRSASIDTTPSISPAGRTA